MLDTTRLYFYLFGFLTLAGGIQGFVTKNSVPSLIAGGISGLLLILAGYLIQSDKVRVVGLDVFSKESLQQSLRSGPIWEFRVGLILGLVVTLALAGRFLPLFFKKGGWWPAGIEGWLGLVGVILSILALVKK